MRLANDLALENDVAPTHDGEDQTSSFNNAPQEANPHINFTQQLLYKINPLECSLQVGYIMELIKEVEEVIPGRDEQKRVRENVVDEVLHYNVTAEV